MGRVGVSAKVGIENPLLSSEKDGQDSLGKSASNAAKPSSADSKCNGAFEAVQAIQKMFGKAHVRGRGHGARHSRKADMDLT